MEFAPTITVAPKRRRRLFGPLLYGTLALGVIELIGLWCYRQWPGWRDWWEARRLAAHLGDPNKSVRDKAADELGKLQHHTGGPVLDALRSGNDEARLAAIELVFGCDAKPSAKIDALVAALDDTLAPVRREAALRLAHASGLYPDREINCSKVVDALRGRLHDGEPTVASQTTNSLVTFGKLALVAVPDLERNLQAPDPSVRFYAAKALNRMDDRHRPEVEVCLWKILREPRPYPSGPWRAWAADELLKLKPEAEDEVIRAFAILGLSPNRRMRREALSDLRYLSSIGYEGRGPLRRMHAALPAFLLAAYTEDGPWQHEAVNAIRRLEPRLAFAVLPILIKVRILPRPTTRDAEWARGHLRDLLPSMPLLYEEPR